MKCETQFKSDLMGDGYFLPLTVLMLFVCCIPMWSQQQRVYTTDADFDEGVLININHDVVHDQLQLDHESIALPFVNVAASKRGTIIRIDAVTGEIIGEYRSAPLGELHNPSRTTVDREGNVWASNRDQPLTSSASGEGSIVKIGIVVGGTRCDKNGAPNPGGAYLKPPFSYSTAVDRDGDGLIRTSRGLGDIHAWTGIQDAASANDECILLYKKLPIHKCRHLSVDADNNLWSGGYSRNNPLKSTMVKLDGQTGNILSLHEDLSCGGYGGLVSAQGTIFSSSMDGGSGALLMLSPAGAATCISFVLSYGLAEDPDGNIWSTTFNDGELFKLSPFGELIPGFPITLSGTWPRGVAVTNKDGHVWVACSGSNTIERRDTTGALVKVFDFAVNSPQGILPTGVAVDANGKVWVTNARSDNVFRIDPEGGGDQKGSIDLIVHLGLDAYPYNYSDMTGAALGENIPRYGSWTVTHDGGTADILWQRLSWTDQLDGDADIQVRARSANTRAELAARTFVRMDNAVLRCDGLLRGRYIEVKAEFFRGSDSEQNPVLYDLTIDGSDKPGIDARSLEFCDGDSVRISADPRFQNVRWNDGSFALSRWVSANGDYWYTGISVLGCLLSSDTIRLETRPAPQPQIIPGTLTICRGEQGRLTASPGYSWYSWNPGSVGDTANSVMVSVPGSYTVTVVDSLGCIGTSPPVSVQWYPVSAIALVPEGDTVLCEGQQLMLRATPGYSEYRWSTGLIGNIDSLLVTKAGLYTVFVVDSNGCQTRSNTVRVEFAPSAEFDFWIDGPTQICANDSIVLRATPGFSQYLWSTGEQGSSDSIVISRAGSYAVTVMDIHGCLTSSDSVWLFVHPEPVVALAADDDTTFCEPGSVRLRATPGFDRYYWSNGEETTTAFLDVAVSGTYRVSIYDTLGCRGTSNPVTVLVHPRPPVDLWMDGGFVLCKASEGTLNATSGYLHYRWSTGESGPESSVVVVDSGSYWVEVEDSYGCIGKSDTVIVAISDQLVPVIGRGSDTLCAGGSMTLDAGPGYASYEWNTGAATQRITITTAGLFSVHVTSGSGCEGDTSIYVYEEVLPSIAMESDSLCPGEVITLDAGAGYASYFWSTGDTTRSISVSAAGDYVVTITSTRGCVMSDTVSIAEYVRPQIRIDGARVACIGSSVVYTLASPAVSAANWTLLSGGQVSGSGNQSAVVITWDEEGTHALRISFDQQLSGCHYDTTIFVTVDDAKIPPIQGETTFCEGSSSVLSADPGAGILTWVFPDGRRVSGSSISAVAAGEYRLVFTSRAGCRDSLTTRVTLNPAPQMNIDGAREFCAGDSTILTAQGICRSCVWHTPGGPVTTRSIVIHNAGQYILEAVSDSGCVLLDTVMVLQHVRPQPVISGDTLIVTGDSTTLSLNSTYASVEWRLPDGSRIPGPQTISAKDSGNYTVSVVNTYGCAGSVTITVHVMEMQATAVIGLPHLVADAGERLIVPLRLLSSSNLAESNASEWDAELRYDRRVMTPIGATPLGWIEGEERVLPLSATWAAGEDVLENLEFLTTLGPVETTPLQLTFFQWNASLVRTTTVAGSVRLEICREGGDRLFDAAGTLQLAQNHPNPFNAETTIEYELIEAGHSEVRVLNTLGRTVAILASGWHEPGLHRVLFDATALPSGCYLCVLRTPTTSRWKRMHLLK